jgi:hypothetical protein
MKRIILLTAATTLFISFLQAQKRAKKPQQTTAYAITGVQKGQSNWTEVRLVDVTTGEELKTIYNSKQEVEILNARTGNPIVKKEIKNDGFPERTVITYHRQPEQNVVVDKLEKEKQLEKEKKIVNLDQELNPNVRVKIEKLKEINKIVELKAVNKVVIMNSKVQSDKPFATNSAACAYDKKHERLYYTPMGINQLRYIDLKSNTPRIYYFEDEPFGALSGPRDVPNQITRMVIASDGNGYALTNDANHLIRFTTKKNTVISDLGALTDDPANGSVSIHNPSGHGGDMIADSKGGLYVLTANRKVFQVDPESRIATYKGTIKGLPKEFTTNGAIVESGTNVIVSSSQSTIGYYRFDLNTLQAEKVSISESVFNASDLANSTLISEKKKKNKEKIEVPIEEKTEAETVQSKRALPGEIGQPVNRIFLYPNPVTNGLVNVSFEDHPQGRYQVQFMDISGKIISTKAVTIVNKVQVEQIKLPKLLAGGNYLVQVIGEGNKVVSTSKVVVQ